MARAFMKITPILLLFFACFVPTSAGSQGGPSLDLESIDNLFALVGNEYIEDVSQAKLINGAIHGMKKFLRDSKLDSSFLKGTSSSGSDGIKIFNLQYNRILRCYPQLKKDDLTYASIRGMLGALRDPYSVFMNPQEYKSMVEQMKGGNFGGVGIYIEIDNNHLTVVEPIEGTPAYRAGIKARDVILKIDGKSTAGFSSQTAQKHLRGSVGTRVVLTIKRKGVRDPFDVPLVRELIRVKTLSYRMLEGEVGYVKLRLFGENTNNEIEEALADLDKGGAKGYILDVRNNGGGYVTAALNVCTKFLPTGSPVVSVVEKRSQPNKYVSGPNMRSLKPLIILVNRFSASASEIAAGALQDLKMGAIVGTKTFGKASVQKIYPLPDGSALKLTTAHYLTPNGRNLNKAGIIPDVQVEMKEDAGDKADIQLEKAKEYLKKMIQEQIVAAARENISASSTEGAIMLEVSSAEYEHIKKSCGEEIVPVQQILLLKDGRFYDRIEIQTHSGEKKVFLFDLSKIYGK